MPTEEIGSSYDASIPSGEGAADKLQKFKEDLEKALGAEQAADAHAQAGADGVDIGDSDPAGEISIQAEKIAIAVRAYLRELAGTDEYVKRP